MISLIRWSRQQNSITTVFPSKLFEEILHVPRAVTGGGVVCFFDGYGKGEHGLEKCVLWNEWLPAMVIFLMVYRFE